MSQGGTQPRVLIYDSSGNPIVFGNTTQVNSIPVTIASDQVAVASKNASGTQVDGHSATLGSTSDADTTNTVIGRLKQIITTLLTRAADRTSAPAPFASRLSDGTAFYDATKTGQLPGALVGGRLDANTGAWLGSTAPTVGQKAMSSCLPVVVASDQSIITTRGEVQLDYDTGAGTQQLSVRGIGLPASGGVVAGGTSTNPLRTDPTGTTAQPVTSAASSQADGHSASIGATTDLAASNTVIGRLKALVAALPTALVGGRLDINNGSWLGSTAPTVGQKTGASSIPVVLPSDQTVPVTQAPSEENTFTVIALGVVIGNNKSMLSIYNPTGSGRTLKLREYYVRNAQTTAVTGVISDFRLLRFNGGTTAPSGGTALTPQAHSTDNTLGVGIDCRTGATALGTGAVEAAATAALDVMKISSDEWGPGTLDQEGSQQTISNYLPARVKRDSTQQPFVIRGNEGIHLKHIVNSTAGSFDIIFIFSQV